jgi:hypothetical protein
MIKSLSLNYGLPAPGRPGRSRAETLRSNLSGAIALWLVPVLMACSSCCSQNDIHEIPAIRGRVVEAKTNRPIVGAHLARWFEQEDGCLAPGGSDVHRVAGSLLVVTSDQSGFFEWPAWASLMNPIRSMNWYVYQAGWVAEDGWLSHPRPGLQGYAFSMHRAEPWVRVDSHPAGSRLAFTITMQPTDSAAAWEAHFQTLLSLTRYGDLEIRYFANEAAAYSTRHELTAEMLMPLANLAASIRSGGTGIPTDQRCEVLQAIHHFCQSSSATPTCGWPIVWHALRDYESGCPRDGKRHEVQRDSH